MLTKARGGREALARASRQWGLGARAARFPWAVSNRSLGGEAVLSGLCYSIVLSIVQASKATWWRRMKSFPTSLLSPAIGKRNRDYFGRKDAFLMEIFWSEAEHFLEQ